MIQSLHGYVKLNNRISLKKKMENIHVPIVVLVDIYTDMYIYHSSLIFHQPYDKSVFLKISLFGKWIKNQRFQITSLRFRRLTFLYPFSTFDPLAIRWSKCLYVQKLCIWSPFRKRIERTIYIEQNLTNLRTLTTCTKILYRYYNVHMHERI